MKIPFSPPYIDKAVINEVVDSLRSGWITSGPKVKALEEEIKVFSGAKEVLCVNSWTSGAIMMLRWLGVKAGDEVIVPAYTYSATALAVLWPLSSCWERTSAGATLIFSRSASAATAVSKSCISASVKNKLHATNAGSAAMQSKSRDSRSFNPFLFMSRPP